MRMTQRLTDPLDILLELTDEEARRVLALPEERFWNWMALQGVEISPDSTTVQNDAASS